MDASLKVRRERYRRERQFKGLTHPIPRWIHHLATKTRSQAELEPLLDIQHVKLGYVHLQMCLISCDVSSLVLMLTLLVEWVAVVSLWVACILIVPVDGLLQQAILLFDLWRWLQLQPPLLLLEGLAPSSGEH